MPSKLINKIIEIGHNTHLKYSAASIEEELKKALSGLTPLREKDPLSGMTALMFASSFQNHTAIMLILAWSGPINSCLINETDDNGKTALHHAINFRDDSEEKLDDPKQQDLLVKKREIIDMLFAHGAKIPGWYISSNWKKRDKTNHIMIDASRAGNLRFLRHHPSECDQFLEFLNFREFYYSKIKSYPSDVGIYFEYCLPAAIEGGIEILKFWSTNQFRHRTLLNSFAAKHIPTLLDQAAIKGNEIYSYVLEEIISHPKMILNFKNSEHLKIILKNVTNDNNFNKLLDKLSYWESSKFLEVATTVCTLDTIKQCILSLKTKIPSGEYPSPAISQAFANIVGLRTDITVAKLLLPFAPFTQDTINVAFLLSAYKGNIELTKLVLALKPIYTFDVNVGLPNLGKEPFPIVYNDRITKLLTAIHYIQTDEAKARETLREVHEEDREILLHYCAHLNPKAKSLSRQLNAELIDAGVQIEGQQNNNINQEIAAIAPPEYDEANINVAKPAALASVSLSGIFAVNTEEKQFQQLENNLKESMENIINFAKNNPRYQDRVNTTLKDKLSQHNFVENKNNEDVSIEPINNIAKLSS